MAWQWERMASPARRLWAGVATRLGIRRSGLMRLRQEVSTCEYEDVRVMWEMLTESGRGGQSWAAAVAAPRSRRRGEESHPWARFGFCFRRF